ncbi:MFS transporter [Longispora albida]|uniref:MFS transporter n=1 Tax=Longispora albida TaxID=203523 RepID=UPI000376AF9A|nr:MFS transporter [Longispora albida]
MTTQVSGSTGLKEAGAAAEPFPRRWAALGVLAIAQLMVVLDATIVNVAMPVAQAKLDISEADKQWMVTAYALTFGGLLLLGGRIADYWGRRKAFIWGSVGFALASALGGAATNGETLFAARALQGAFGALLAPAGLALLTVLFTDVKERAKAFAVYGAIAGGGAAVGLVAGGVLTEYASWRWTLLVNIPIALLAVVLAIMVLPESKAKGNTKYDIPGAITVTLGLVAIVYGATQAADEKIGWTSFESLGYIIGGIALLIAFVLIQVKSKNPLLPMRILLDRNRGAAYLSGTLTGVGMFGAFLFLTYYFQAMLKFTPVEAGLASLPITVGVFIAAGAASGLMPKVGAKPLMAAGSVLAALSIFALTRIGIENNYTTEVLPAMLALGLGMGLTFVPLSNLALIGVPEQDSGVASATLNATQQVGGALGTALLNTFAINAATAYAKDHQPKSAAEAPLVQANAMLESFHTAFIWGGIFLAASAVVIILLVKVRKEDLPTEAAPHVG